MRTRNAWPPTLALLFSLLLAAGPTPDAAAGPQASVSPFIGTYSGGFRNAWRATITVASTGHISGTSVLMGINGYVVARGTAKGSVADEGAFRLKLNGGKYQAWVEGQASLDENGDMALAMSNGDSTVLYRE